MNPTAKTALSLAVMLAAYGIIVVVDERLRAHLAFARWRHEFMTSARLRFAASERDAREREEMENTDA